MTSINSLGVSSAFWESALRKHFAWHISPQRPLQTIKKNFFDTE
jgi:hypothetical protein